MWKSLQNILKYTCIPTYKAVFTFTHTYHHSCSEVEMIELGIKKLAATNAIV